MIKALLQGRWLSFLCVCVQGETREPKKDMIYVDSEGNQRHVKDADAKLVEREKEGVHPGKVMAVTGGTHRGLLCDVLALEPKVSHLCCCCGNSKWQPQCVCSCRLGALPLSRIGFHFEVYEDQGRLLCEMLSVKPP